MKDRGARLTVEENPEGINEQQHGHPVHLMLIEPTRMQHVKKVKPSDRVKSFGDI